MTDRELTACFNEMNVQYFGGRLSAYRVHFRRRMQAGTASPRGYCDRRARIITLNANLSNDRKIVHYVLIHEMAHAVAGSRHDCKWVDEMKRLRTAGAPVFEFELLHGDSRLRRQYVEGSAEEYLHDIYLQDEPQDTVRGFVTAFGYREIGLTRAATLRQFPWIRGVFHRVRQRIRAELAAEQRLREQFDAWQSGTTENLTKSNARKRRTRTRVSKSSRQKWK